ncbi:hypothetical protein INT44_002563 [Umbelopsis vinacea]|uniref:Cellulase n=1 Tax=Umbelopsis vinacea TaxID=44442 RepID=A0A8H7PEP7_9FUNG|nr:hypothetical protein INT44_002563 [Umbelopsis vinacea]
MKLTIVTVSLSALVAFAAADTCASAWGQCGGIGWTGPTCCASGSTCVPQSGNPYYSQCMPGTGGSSATTTTTKATTTSSGPTTTKSSTTTTTTTTTTTKTTTTTTASGPSITPLPGGHSGSGSTTRYWDCCKPSCAWTGKGSVTAPVNSCAADGVSVLSNAAKSGCDGGSAYMCNNQQPWAVNDNLSYGFAATNIAGLSETDWCCTCYALTFTSGPVAGKTHVVQITNTGGDLNGNQFDIEIPGGGVGIFNGCSSQWNAPSNGWGDRYGGVSSAADCSTLPSALQAGCQWRFNWFQNADNPSVNFVQVQCPSALTAITGCARTN